MYWMKLKKFMKMGSFSSKIAKFDAQWSLRAASCWPHWRPDAARILRHFARLRSKRYSRSLRYVSLCALYPRMTIVPPDLRAWGRPPWAQWGRRRSSAWRLRHSTIGVSAGNHKRSKWYILHYARMCSPQYFAQSTLTCNCAAYHAGVVIRRPLVAEEVTPSPCCLLSALLDDEPGAAATEESRLTAQWNVQCFLMSWWGQLQGTGYYF